MSNETYIVKGKAEEFDCPHCGSPVYSGDTAVLHDDTTYCSHKCATVN